MGVVRSWCGGLRRRGKGEVWCWLGLLQPLQANVFGGVNLPPVKRPVDVLRTPKGRHGFSNERGQATVELAVLFPVLLIVAVIAVNALLFFGECASFDRLACEAVRVHATSPAYGQDIEQSAAKVAQSIQQSCDRPYLSSRVATEAVSGGHVRFTATLEFFPTLFGLGLKSSVFGVSLPHLEHAVSLVVDPYKPGVLL